MTAKIIRIVFILFIIFLIPINIYVAVSKRPEVVLVEKQEDNFKQYWQNVIAKNPTYRDAYIELVKIALKEGNYKEAREALTMAEKIDPNSEKVKEYYPKVLGISSKN